MKIIAYAIFAAAIASGSYSYFHKPGISDSDALEIARLQGKVTAIQGKLTEDGKTIQRKYEDEMRAIQSKATAEIAALPKASNEKAAEIQKKADQQESAIHDKMNKEISEIQFKANSEALPSFKRGEEIQAKICKSNGLAKDCEIDIDKMQVHARAAKTSPAPAK